ncbi:MAG: PmoA family protein [Dysgonamonadaceae bacterium]|jgi:hypothetical protein|nr:PmoA family protein [Dysgonamonadaceae bacterium]
MKRRNFFKKSLLVSGALVIGRQVFANNHSATHYFKMPENVGKPVPTFGDPAVNHLTTYIYDSPESAVWVRWKNQILTCYRAEAFQKYPYFFPFRALKSGLSLTTETAQPWPHHRSVFFGLDRVNGANFWQNNPDKDRIVSQKLELGECTETSSEIFNECLWIPFEKEPIIADKRHYVINIIDDNTYTLDAFIELTALTEVVCDKTNHGLFGVRLERDLSVDGGGVLINSEGQQTQANTHNQFARWMAAYGKRYGRSDELTEGLAIMTPSYKREPFNKNIWFTRDYGNFSPMPFDAFERGEQFMMPKGDVLKLAYRIVAFTGEPKTSFLNAQWEEFAALADGKHS